MGANSKIEWTDHTANLWWGCTHVHEGCDNCYAEAWSKRFDGGNTVWGNDAPRREIAKTFNDLKRYQKKAAELGEIHRVFVGSMMDIFEKPMPVIDSKGVIQPITTEHIRQKFFREIVPNSPNLLFLLLTKRPSNINKYIPNQWYKSPPDNVMFGTSIVNQKTADTLLKQLIQVNGRLFISMEPQLDLVYLRSQYLDCLHWVIQGGESGPRKRPFNTEWAEFTKQQCETAKVPYFFKQIDKIQEIPEHLQIREFPKEVA